MNQGLERDMRGVGECRLAGPGVRLSLAGIQWILSGAQALHLSEIDSDESEKTLILLRISSTFVSSARPHPPHPAREDGTIQSNALGAALRKADTPAEVKGFAGRGLQGHREINRDLGKPTYPFNSLRFAPAASCMAALQRAVQSIP
jgi:hypothetical protein